MLVAFAWSCKLKFEMQINTNADLKNSIYVLIDLKITPWNFRILSPKNSRVMSPLVCIFLKVQAGLILEIGDTGAIFGVIFVKEKGTFLACAPQNRCHF